MQRFLEKRVLIILVSLAAAAACSSTRPVSFQSDPPGAVLRVEGEEYYTPCVVEIPDEKTTVELALGPRRVMRIDIPEDYGFWDRTGEAAGTAGAYALYGIAAPLIVTGVIGESIFTGGGYQVSGEETAGGLVVIFGALTGRVIGGVIAAGGESLEESSALEDVSILAVFPPATPPPTPREEDEALPGSTP